MLQLPWVAEVSIVLGYSVPFSPAPPPSAAFWPDPEQRVVVLHLNMLDVQVPTRPHRGIRSYIHSDSALLVIPCTTFHKYIGVNTTNIQTPIPWEIWGRRGSVLIQDQHQRSNNPTPSIAFPCGSRLTFFSHRFSSDGGLRPITLDTNPLAKLHPPHPGCTRRNELPGVEKLNIPGISSSLKTTHCPRSYYLGPHIPQADARHALTITQNASGYAILVGIPSGLLPTTNH